MSTTEKIIARHVGAESVTAGDVVLVDVDLTCVDDIQIFLFQQRLRELGDSIRDPSKVLLIADHYLPPSGDDEASVVSTLARFGRERGLRTLLKDGIKHPVFIERRYAVPGQILVATDSHTNTAGAVATLAVALGPTDVAAAVATGKTWMRVPPTIRIELTGSLRRGTLPMDVGLYLLGQYGRTWATYKTIEWAGPVVDQLGLSGRMTLCNLTTEFGAKNGIVPADSLTREYANGLTDAMLFCSDADAEFFAVCRHDLDELDPQIAAPPNPANVHPVSEFEGTRIDQAYLGTCTHGTLEDLHRAASVLRGRTAHPRVRLLVTPASSYVYQQALDDGTLRILVAAGATICSPGCGSCPGMHEGTLAEGEVRISTQNRNFSGRSGHPNAEIYLASPETVAASAVAGQVLAAKDL